MVSVETAGDSVAKIYHIPRLVRRKTDSETQGLQRHLRSNMMILIPRHLLVDV